MANYVACSRTNYFKVKDSKAFVKWCNQWNTDMDLVRGGENDELYGLVFDGPIPSQRYEISEEEEYEDWVDVEFTDELAEHLAEGSVAVVMETGHERRRYVVGIAIAINSDGEFRTVRLDSIYELAKELGENITRAEY